MTRSDEDNVNGEVATPKRWGLVKVKEVLGPACKNVQQGSTGSSGYACHTDDQLSDACEEVGSLRIEGLST